MNTTGQNATEKTMYHATYNLTSKMGHVLKSGMSLSKAEGMNLQLYRKFGILATMTKEAANTNRANNLQSE